MKPSWMTYGVLKELSRRDLLQMLKDHGFEGVEFRTDAGHGHGVEASIDEAEREQVVADCEAMGIDIMSVATGNRYHDTDPDELRDHIEQTMVRTWIWHRIWARHACAYLGIIFQQKCPGNRRLRRWRRH